MFQNVYGLSDQMYSLLYGINGIGIIVTAELSGDFIAAIVPSPAIRQRIGDRFYWQCTGDAEWHQKFYCISDHWAISGRGDIRDRQFGGNYISDGSAR